MQYNNPATWGLSYNLYADKLLKFNLFPQSVYTERSSSSSFRGNYLLIQTSTAESAWYKTVGRLVLRRESRKADCDNLQIGIQDCTKIFEDTSFVQNERPSTVSWSLIPSPEALFVHIPIW